MEVDLWTLAASNLQGEPQMFRSCQLPIIVATAVARCRLLSVCLSVALCCASSLSCTPWYCSLCSVAAHCMLLSGFCRLGGIELCNQLSTRSSIPSDMLTDCHW